jgi:hypothetical protein
MDRLYLESPLAGYYSLNTFLMSDRNDGTGALVGAGLATLIVGLGIIGFLFWFFPTYGVWQAGLSGRASLMRAQQEKQIQIEQARGELESARLREQAIRIVGQATKDFPEYRQQEFIGAFAEAVKSGAINQIIYVPTEANIPITESHRLAPKSSD